MTPKLKLAGTVDEGRARYPIRHRSSLPGYECRNCGAVFTRPASDVRKGGGKFCSRRCHFAARLTVPIEDRFWPKVDRRDADECWPWRGAFTSTGYGHLNVGGKDRRATHISWELKHGEPFPEGLYACHSCDNPTCVNPAHIFAGTQKDNMQDMSSKGRGRTPLYSDDLVARIRADAEQNGLGSRRLARKYGVSPSHVARILTNESRSTRWEHERGDCAARTVATREPSRVSPSRPCGRVSTIAGENA